MKPIIRNAYRNLPLTPEQIEAMYVPAFGIAMCPSREDVRRICESHERLRMELEGAMAMVAELEAKAK